MQETREDIDAAAIEQDIAVTPFAIPVLAGPGAISTVAGLPSAIMPHDHPVPSPCWRSRTASPYGDGLREDTRRRNEPLTANEQALIELLRKDDA